MSDEQTKPKVVLAEPPQNWREMTEDEKYAWAAKISERLKPDDA
jgi:hypothetical protein